MLRGDCRRQPGGRHSRERRSQRLVLAAAFRRLPLPCVSTRVGSGLAATICGVLKSQSSPTSNSTRQHHARHGVLFPVHRLQSPLTRVLGASWPRLSVGVRLSERCQILPRRHAWVEGKESLPKPAMKEAHKTRRRGCRGCSRSCWQYVCSRLLAGAACKVAPASSRCSNTTPQAK